MFNGVEYVRGVCRQRKIPVAQLEKDCGFANGYLNPKKLKKIPYDRAQKIAEYLHLSLEYIMTGEEKASMPERADREAMAAFFAGADVPDDEMDELWEDAKDYIAYKLNQKRKRNP